MSKGKSKIPDWFCIGAKVEIIANEYEHGFIIGAKIELGQSHFYAEDFRLSVEKIDGQRQFIHFTECKPISENV